jgi:protein SCO1
LAFLEGNQKAVESLVMNRWFLIGGVVLLGLLGAGVACIRGPVSPLPHIRAAPDFNLITQEETSLSLTQLRGKVVVIAFIYTNCPDECPLLTAQLAALQSRLGSDFGSRVFFISITADPERDTPEVLKAYAERFGAKLQGWAFLTGNPEEIASLVRRYGLFAHVARDGSVEHTFLTSIIDRSGTVRVQYLGTGFDSDEMFADIQSLIKEGR